ncbi:MAG: hypothetical protein VYE32_04575 [Candidatus Thermoplasmatota archaeon]|nr:hypothetical protein [Candidatus Thermoplasmatota archaeon]
MYKVDGNRDLARDPDTNSIVNVNNMEYTKYISSRNAKQKKNENFDSMKNDLDNLKNEMNEIKSLLKELVNGN